jgi:4a-hydroxytetrahydrobiopterin dehydratase
MPTLLTDDLIAETLTALPGWTSDGTRLVRELHLPAKVDAELRRQVAVDGHAMGHLPTVEDLAEGTRFCLSTEEVGGVSELDVTMASHISDLAHRLNDSEPGIDAVRDDDVEVPVTVEAPAPAPETLNQRVL